jgi:hypothetical protein
MHCKQRPYLVEASTASPMYRDSQVVPIDLLRPPTHLLPIFCPPLPLFCRRQSSIFSASVLLAVTRRGLLMKIAKPMLLITTPIGVLGGLREAYRFNPGLAFLMGALLTFITVAVAMLVLTIRKEQAEERARLILSQDVDDHLSAT